MTMTDDIFSLLGAIPAEGAHIRELAKINELNDGFSASLGLRFVEIDHENCRAELHVDKSHLQVSGVVNGGVYCAIAESVGSVMGVVAAQGKLVAGVNNNTDFIKPVSAGVISAHAQMIRNGHNTQLINVEMFHRDQLVARTTLRTMLAPVPVKGNPGRAEDKFVEYSNSTQTS
ncbi:PaaI family thioesterase [Corynebacterium kutscheri]|nr:PaaI family thioesterase [Corynebacterium kutscheri]